MSHLEASDCSDEVFEVLLSVRSKGVKLWEENGRVRYAAPVGVLTTEELQSLKTRKGEIAKFLREEVAIQGPYPRSRTNTGRLPLAYSQLAHWNLYQLAHRPSVRNIASATRLRGELEIDLFRKSVTEVVRQHEALRTKIAVENGMPVQEVTDAVEFDLLYDDLTALPQRARGIEVQNRAKRILLQPIDVTSDPLVAMHLLRLEADEHVFIVAMEHMVSDAYSVSVLLRDLSLAYKHACRGRPIRLPVVPVQFADFAVWQREIWPAWLKLHGRFWEERLAGCDRIRFPSRVSETNLKGWGVVRFQIERCLKEELRNSARSRQTTLAMIVFTAYAGLLFRWCEVSDAVILYQTDGRRYPKIEGAVGYFASLLYLRMELFDNDDFLDLMERLVREYCAAYEHADFSYFESQQPRPAFTRNSCFNWRPEFPNGESVNIDTPHGPFDASQVSIEYDHLENFDRDTEPIVILVDAEHVIDIQVMFSLSRFEYEEMKRFGANLLRFIRALVQSPRQKIRDILLL